MSTTKVELGRRLFYDRRLSETGEFACASCHRQELAFTDGKDRAIGATSEVHPRGAMSLANVAYNTTLAWADPSLTSLEQQARVPMFNRHPVELGVAGDGTAMLARLAADSAYPLNFQEAFPNGGGVSDTLTVDNVVRAIAAFQRTLISGRSAYDRRVYLDDRSAMSDAAWRGMRLFFTERLSCFKCHNGFNFSGPTRSVAAAVQRSNTVSTNTEPTGFHNTGLYNLGTTGLYPADNLGLGEHTSKPEDIGRFRAPTLRNVGLTAPYMHDGSLRTLSHVIDHYAAGGRTLTRGPYPGVGRDNPNKSPLVTGFQLTALEKSDLIAFLHSLTDEAFVTDPRHADPFDRAAQH